ncbi:MAG: hypothetical protein CME71_12885 [Halobacteriovorax sp.]|nr:hypothetical protein [Halobacteriovorax sp.]|tara:strand:+ start:155 stop:538 length:384 start_codon:yes stop_codon:yes gene_type:complete
MKTLKEFAGFEYVTVQIEKSSISIQDAALLESKLAKEIVQTRPLRGREVHFLRKQTGLSYVKLSQLFQNSFDPSTIAKWEKRVDERLSPANESLVRLYFAIFFGVKLKANPDELYPRNTAKEIRYAC